MVHVPFLLLVGLVLFTFFWVSFGSHRFRLPSVLIYIVLGVGAAYPFPKNEALHWGAEIGIVLLFFLLGLEFPLARMVEISRRIALAGLLDVFLNLGGAMALALIFRLDALPALILGAVAYATSSSISAKMLEEQKRLANPEAEFILALLIFEDLVSPLLVSFIAAAGAGEEMTASFTLLLILKILLLVAGAVAIGLYGFRRLQSFITKHLQKEFMPLFTVGVALAYAGIAMAVGLSEILGAFLAGVMLSETGKSSEIEHLILPIRDITLPFFFFWFGTTISFGEGISDFWLLGLIILWAVAGKFLTGYTGGRLFGLSAKVSMRAGFSIIPRGEFSAIIASLAPAQLRVLSGIYILVTAFIGVYLFQKAPDLASRYFDKKRR